MDDATIPSMLVRMRSVALALVVSACGSGGPLSESGVIVLPSEVDMPVGFSHDVLLVSCERSSTLPGLLAMEALTLIFSVEGGRLDALLAVPGATVDAVLQGPQLGGCSPVDFQVDDVTVSIDDWQLEPTESPKAYRLHANSSGEASLLAQVEIDGEPAEARSTFRAHEIMSVTFDPLCDFAYEQQPPNVWIPAGGAISFSQVIWHDDLQLVGYGGSVVDLGDRLTLLGFRPGGTSAEGVPFWYTAVVDVAVGEETGPVTLTSPYDPAYEQPLMVYDDAAIDGLRAERLKILLAGHESDLVQPAAHVEVMIIPTIAGEDVCRAEVHRRATIETPDVCEWSDTTDATLELTTESSRAWMRAKAPGTCRIRATIPGTALSTSLEYDVLTPDCDVVEDGCYCFDAPHACVPACGDLDGDGRYSMDDWENVCAGEPSPTTSCCVLQIRDFDRDRDFDQADCDAWLAWWNAAGSDDGTPECASN